MLNWVKSKFLSAASLVEIDYLLNDPSTPDLKTHIQVPPYAEVPRFAVQGWNGDNAISDVQKQAAQVYTTICVALGWVKKIKPVTHWAATDTLIGDPRSGRDLNAFYDRAALRFFFNNHPVTQKMVFAADSADVVSHELGHAILDSLRPDLWDTQSLEIFAFHEAFGDIVAVLTSLQHDEMIDYILNQTNGNLRQSNATSKLAEEVGDAIRPGSQALRDAVNSYKYMPPEQLPPTGDLIREPHSFSRVFTGAWYDIFVAVYEEERLHVIGKDAVKIARDVVASLVLNAIPMAANTSQFYNSIARSMMAISDSLYGGKYNTQIYRSFAGRNIMQIYMLSPNKDVDIKTLTVIHQQKIGNHYMSVRAAAGDKEVRLINAFPDTALPSQLASAIIQLPAEKHLFLDNNTVLHEISTDPLEAAHTAVKFLHEKDQISYDNAPDARKGFSLVNEHLIRNRTCILH